MEGMTFKIVTDHMSLKWLMSQKDLTGRLARWSLKLQGFDFSIEHRKGSENVVPDALSRVHVDELCAEQDTCFPLDFDASEFEAPDYQTLKSRILAEKELLPDLEVRGKQIYIRTKHRRGDEIADNNCWKLYIPVGMVKGIIAAAHDPLASHSGMSKTLEKLRRSFYFPKMAVHVKAFIDNCRVCKETKAPNVTLRPEMGKQITVERPWQRVFTDLLGPYPRSKSGNTFLLVVLDQFSKFVLLKPLRKATAIEVTRFLEQNVLHVFGIPESIWSDNEVQFISREFKALLKLYGIRHITTASHSPQSNASERVNRSILAAIRSYMNHEDQRTWDESISSIGSALRNNRHESTGFSPYYLVFGQDFIEHGSVYRLMRELQALPENDIEVLPPADFRLLLNERVKRNLESAYRRHEKAYNTRSRAVSFRPGMNSKT